MLLFNILLLLHFMAFAGYLFLLATLWKDIAARRDKTGLILGIIILLTGIGLVALKYPAVNYYKVVPKLAIFVVITVLNVRFADKPFTRAAYYSLAGLMLLAALIAVTRV
ncbi:hypothetical protein [Chitinophaga qingshengii]|uniref:Uncharacterized protein n=1 Tax=Chitinophaga qingshengii TaxID=1569794 RepID=A0ABR7TNA8_9BACT|nr:hypothetical protein [Chitinophaga qingshengii]MBC9931033.1 hypothetical protein [Chitinophaga qingshengii]